MRLVVLDTNVVVSAGIKRDGFPARIIRSVIQEANIQVAVSPSIIAEYRRVSRYSKFAQYDFPPVWLEFMIESALRFPDGASWPHPLPDPDDARFLSLAKTTGAWLITGNLKHYPVGSRRGVTVRTPAEYAAMLDETY
jgi:putative PIN family toxin of toxin-antitoxin system